MNNQEEKSLEKIQQKEKLGTKFINIIKKKWLISGSMTCALITIMVLLFTLITYGMQALDLTPLDLTKEKQYTLTDESKEKVASLDKDVNVYMIGYNEDSSTATIIKQYNKANNKINVEVVDIKQRSDLAQKYGIEDLSSEGIIVECGERNRVLSSSDLYTYDQSTYETIDITEEKLTASILSVTTEKMPKVYVLSTYTNQSISSANTYLNMYLENEIIEVENLDLLTKGSVPQDCDALIIMTPEKDFEDIVANEIIKYMNNGGNILWFNGSYGVDKKLPNVNKVLANYGVKAFDTGYILETDSNKMISGAPYIVIPEFGYSKITSDLTYVALVQATKINLESSEKLEELKVESENILKTSEKSLFRSDVTNSSTDKIESDEAGSFTVGTKLTKTINDDKKSTLIIYGENYFITDNQLPKQSQTPLIAVYNNKDIAINSVDMLIEKEEDITVRKAKEDVTSFTATEQETIIIMSIIFIVPLIIIIVGIVVWQVRRRRK